MLVLSVGVAEASRQTGIDLSTVKQWSARGGWLAHTRVKQEPRPLPTSMQPTVVTGVTSPADALQAVLVERFSKTKLGQSKYLVRASEALADVPDEQLLVHAPIGQALAAMASKVYPEQASEDRVVLQFFQISQEPEPPVIDV